MPPALRTFPYGRTAAAIGLGTLGGFAFAALHVPLPWMMGSMLICLVAVLLRVPIAAPAPIRVPVSMVLGTLIGVNFTPEVLSSAGNWLIPLAGMVVALLVSALLTVTYFRRLAGYDITTAYFCGMPGGLAEMVLIGDQMGGDPRKIALIHASRILMVVTTLPFIAQFVTGGAIQRSTQMPVSIFDTPPETWFWFGVAAVVGTIVGIVLRLPAKFLLGPMLVSLVIHAMGWNSFVPPFEIVIAAQVVMGATIGCRFGGTPIREIAKILGYAVGSFLVLMAVAIGFALLVSLVSEHGFIELLLAYAPGGLGEMGLVALSLNLEVAFVATHHIFRVLMVNFGAATVARLAGLDQTRRVERAPEGSA